MSLTTSEGTVPVAPSGAERLMQDVGESSGSYANFYEWAMKVPEPKRGRLDFSRFPYQRELFDQESALDKEVVVMKATQVGVSTYLLRWVMYLADTRGLTSLYLFPKRQQMYDFADARIKAAIMGSAYLRGRIDKDDVQNKGLKKVGLGYLYCRGSESKDDLQTIDADGLAMDEYDDIRPENIPDAERRLSGSDVGLLRRVGVPDLPGRGLDALYEATDKRRWFVRCESCGERQPLSYDDNVDEVKGHLKCAKCGKGPLDVAHGEWVAEYPDRDVRGYHLSRLIVPGQNIGLIAKRHKLTDPSEKKAHFTKDLGVAYAPAEGRLGLDRIKAAQREEIPLVGSKSGEFRTMGVDVASVRALNVRISGYDSSGVKRALYLGLADSFSEVARLMREYDVNFALIDHLPEGRLARALSEEFPGRVFLVHFSAPTQKEVLKLDPDLRMVSVRRLEAIDATLDSIRTQQNLLPGELPENYADQLQNLVRVKTEDEWGKVKVSYRELGPVDWAMAEVYDLCAHDAWLALKSVDEGYAGELTTLDELYDIERTALDMDSGGDDDYKPGFE